MVTCVVMKLWIMWLVSAIVGHSIVVLHILLVVDSAVSLVAVLKT